MKQYILFAFILLATNTVFPNFLAVNQFNAVLIENQIERKLSDDEIKERGLDLLATEVIEQIQEIDLRKMARSAIFETPYGFRWKMINLQTGTIIIVKVDNDFSLISARNSKEIN